MATASEAAGHPGEIQEREMRPPASASPSNSSDDHCAAEQKEDIEPKEGVDASGGPLLGKRTGESIKIGTVTNDNGTYEGELKDGKAHGNGINRFPSGNVYNGEWKDGELHGKGTFRWKEGDIYEGQFVEGKCHGKGTMKFASSPHEGDVYEGEYEDGKRHGRGIYKYASGTVYDGEWKDGDEHGWGTMTHAKGNVYEGQFMEGNIHGRGTMKYPSGDVYEGQWVDGNQTGWGTFKWADGDVYVGEVKEGELHGKGTMKYSSGDIYEGDWKDSLHHGTGTKTFANGSVYEGAFVDGERHGWGAMKWPSGNLHEGGWKDDKQHGRGTVKWKNGDVYEGELENGHRTRGTMTWAGGETWTGRFFHDGNATGTPPLSSGDARAVDFALDPPCEPPIERKLRSPQSQQRRLQNSAVAKQTCEYCGIDDGRYKLRACSGCNLALYCSAACQKAASGSHRRICDIVSGLPPRESDRLALLFDNEKANDFDAGLRYGSKYMSNLKHLEINLEAMSGDESVKLSAKKLSSLLRSKREALDSVFWLSNDYIHVPGIGLGDTAWKELHGLKQLRLEFMRFDDDQPILDIIDRQRNSLLVLSLSQLGIEWSKSKCRKRIAKAVSACKHLVKLDLSGCLLMDSDLKTMLQDLPHLRCLYLGRHPKDNHEFTDNTCGLIARKCPGLQELDLHHHNQLSVRGIRKIFEGCVHVRAFYTTTCKLTCGDIRELLDIAPQLLYLYLGDKTDLSKDELSRIIEATGGRTALKLTNDCVFEPDGVSAKVREKYESQRDVLRAVWKRRCDPEVANEWAGMLEG